MVAVKFCELPLPPFSYTELISNPRVTGGVPPPCRRRWQPPPQPAEPPQTPAGSPLQRPDLQHPAPRHPPKQASVADLA